jgi:2-oxoglutarate ferredoxin oxidoreductase subunit alpha
MILSDGMLGQMMEPVEFPQKKDEPVAEKPWATNGHKGQRKKNIINSLYIQPEELENLIKERYERYEKIKAEEQRAEEFMTDDADVVVVAFGASSRVSRSAVMQARAEGIKAGLIRPITLWPFPDKTIEKHVDHTKQFLCVEMNMGQMVDDVRLVVSGRKPVSFFGRTGGVIPTPAEVLDEIRKLAGKEN